MRRRFVFDEATGQVVEVGTVRGPGLSASARYAETYGQHQHQFDRAPLDGSALRHAALDRADRRVWADKKFGNESRWAE